MQRQRLGKSDVTISRVILGCMGFASSSEDEWIRTIHAACDAGITSFDTAPLYRFGASEEVLGKAIADRRGRVEILTKVGLRWDGQHGQILFQSPDGPGGRPVVVRKDGRATSVRQEVEQSLRRLGVESVDLLQLHHPDPETPIEETLGALAALKREGKARAIGVSNVSLAKLRACARAVAPPTLAAAQLEYNLLQRVVEPAILPWARAAEVAVLAYSPLAQGLLAGRQLGGQPLPPDWRRDAPYFGADSLVGVNRALEAAALPLARARQCSLAQLGLAWLLRQPGVAGVVVGASGPARAQECAAAGDLVMTAEEDDLLRTAFANLAPRPRERPAGLAEKVLAKAGGLLRRKLFGG